MDDGASGINAAMFAPWHTRCGIRDYTKHLVHALDLLPEIRSVRIVAAPPDAVRTGRAAIRLHRQDDAQFRLLGQAMNAGSDVAHVQHQYFLFGGVSPLKSHIRAFLNELRVPTVMTVHEIAEGRRGLADRWAIATANRLNFRHGAIRDLIVHTEADRRRLLAIGVGSARVHIIRHAVPPALPLPDPRYARTVLESRHPELAGHRIVTIFGFLSSKKGHGEALAALSLMPDDIALVFAGDRHPDDHTDYVPALKSEITRLGLGRRVAITGYLSEEDVPTIMAATDVALAPFLSSSGSGSLANLIAYGRAIIASDIAPHRELVAEEPGLLALAPSHDPGRLAADVVDLLDDPARRDQMERSALAYAAQHTYETMARETARVYEQAVSCVR
jgi:glycosyltransferase involved in cell wall biosynthesis